MINSDASKTIYPYVYDSSTIQKLFLISTKDLAATETSDINNLQAQISALAKLSADGNNGPNGMNAAIDPDSIISKSKKCLFNIVPSLTTRLIFQNSYLYPNWWRKNNNY